MGPARGKGHGTGLAAGVVLAALVQPAFAVQYHTLEQVRQVLFPSATSFSDQALLLTQAQRKAVADKADVEVSGARIHAWAAMAGDEVLGYVMVDAVTGKNDLINYAVALSTQGRVLGIEIMEYRETYGGQVREARWRNQFVGKGAADPLRLERDIHNISGATLSCKHVTDGVRRLVAIFDAVLRPRS